MGHKIYDKKYGENIKNFAEQSNKDFGDNSNAKRFFVTDASIGKCVIEGEEHNHLANVMRLKVNDEIVLTRDDEFDYLGKILEVKKNQTVVEIYNKVKNLANPKVNITAFVAMNKREHTSLMVRMLSELGVSYYVPIITKWTLKQDITEKVDRFQKIADQSIKQCRRSKTLKVEKPQKLDDICKQFNNFDKVFFAYENEQTQKLNFKNNKTDNANNDAEKIQNIAFIIGPVAGFDIDEAKQIAQAGAISVSLGKRILRADTATIMIASLLSNYYLD